jgi:hypothetical protein
MVKETPEGTMILGSFAIWLLVRLATSVLALYSLYLALQFGVSFHGSLALAIALCLLYGSHLITYGVTDERGIRYRRYLRWTHVPWHSIVSITQTARVTMSIVVERRSFFMRHLIFLAGPNPSRLGKLPEAFPKLRNIWLEGRRI